MTAGRDRTDGTDGTDHDRLRALAFRVFRVAVEAADPRRTVRRTMTRLSGEIVKIARFPEQMPRLGLVAFGKASAGMTLGALEGLQALAGQQAPPRAGLVLGGGVVVGGRAAGERSAGEAARREVENRAPGLRFLTGSHPYPDRRSVEAAVSVERYFGSESWDRLLVLVSGGASALLCAPAEGLTLADKMEATRSVMEAGASIEDLNTVRKHLSRIKGGGLATSVDGRPVLVLVLSDVPGDALTTIASGPLVADPTTFAEALEVVDSLSSRRQLPAAARRRLASGARGEIEETPKPGDSRFRSIEHRIVAGNALSVEAAAAAAEEIGYVVERWPDPVVGAAREAGRGLAKRAIALSNSKRAALIAGGETTVRVEGRGRGGRNQELALSFALEMEKHGRQAGAWVFLSAGTDGVDGPTDAAGAVVDDGTLRRVRAAGIDPLDRLDDNDAYPVLQAAGDLLVTGPTGTNVADVQLFLGGRSPLAS